MSAEQVPETTALFAAADWSASSLGPVDEWPPSLRAAVSICLSSRFPILLLCGPDLLVVYNDACRPILGPSKHPAAFASPGPDVWPEAWSVIGTMIEDVMSGRGATWSEDQLLLLDRHGLLEECYFTSSLSPITLDDGAVGGVFCAVTETTEQILTARRLGILDALTTRLGGLSDEHEVLLTATDVLRENPADHPFVTFVEPVTDPAGHPADDPDSDHESDHSDDVALHSYRIERPGSDATVLVLGESGHRPWDAALESYAARCVTRVETALSGIRRMAVERTRADRLAELGEAKSTFFTNVSHELRTPLSLITGTVGEALADRTLSPEQSARLSMLQRNTTRLARMVDAMLDFDRIAAGWVVPHLVPIDVAAMTLDLAARFRPAIERGGLVLTVDCDSLPGDALLDRDMFERIVLNLLTNALKYTPEGSITLRLRDEAAGFAITVSDTGAGIEEAYRERVFERFEQLPRGPLARSQEGAGIGLAMVKQLTELLGGSVELASEVGRGSTFTIHLPYEAPRPAAAEGRSITPRHIADFLTETEGWNLPYAAGLAPRAGPPSLPGEIGTTTPDQDEQSGPSEGGRGRPRIVVAEDNADMRAFLETVLSDVYDMSVLRDGLSALEEIRRRRPDLVLADVMMPGLDGIGLVREIRADASLADLPVVLVSARAGVQAATTGLESGADDYLVKPFAVGELRARLASNLERARARARNAAWRRAVMASFHDPLVIADASGRAIELNVAFTELFGWAIDDGPFDPPHPWWPDPATRELGGAGVPTGPDPHPAEAGSPESDPSMRRELALVTKEGKPVWVVSDVRRVESADEQDAIVMTTLRDVSREHDARERRAAAVRLSAEFGTAQDLTQVLSAAVAGFAELFDGETTVRATAGAEDHVFTAAGPVERADVDPDVWEAMDQPDPQDDPSGDGPGAAGSAPVRGLLLAPDPPGSACRVWVQFDRPRRVTADERIVGSLLAQAFSLAVDRVVAAADFADHRAHLERAVESHRLVGQAIGILVERHRVTPAQAFAMLRTASQERNIKLREIATRVIETGVEPDQAN